MKSLFLKHLFILVALCILPAVVNGQGLTLPIPDRNKEWRRLSTDQGSTTEVGVSTLVLEPSGMIRATFRIELSKSEEAAEKPGAKYKKRIMTIQFDARNKAYRIFETTLQDSSDKTVFASGPNPSAAWKPIARSSATYFAAATNLSPLGYWKVISSSDPQAIANTQYVTATLDRFQVGSSTCTAPKYESTKMSREDLAKLTGLSLNNLELGSEKVDVLKIKCDSSTLSSEIHLLIPRPGDHAILLSGGTLLALQK